MLINFLTNTLNQITGLFTFKSDFRGEYPFKLDGYYYNSKDDSIVVVVQIRNKRAVEILPVKELALNKNVIKELHPFDACIIGILANNERNGIVDKSHSGRKRMNRIKHNCTSLKSEPILQVSRKYMNEKQVEITTLRSECLNKEIEIPTAELYKNEALLYALDPKQAISIGYDTSETFIRNSKNSKEG